MKRKDRIKLKIIKEIHGSPKYILNNAFIFSFNYFYINVLSIKFKSKRITFTYLVTWNTIFHLKYISNNPSNCISRDEISKSCDYKLIRLILHKVTKIVLD